MAESRAKFTKVIYNDGERTRALKGEFVSEDDFFIEILTKNHKVKLAKSTILRIEDWRVEE